MLRPHQPGAADALIPNDVHLGHPRLPLQQTHVPGGVPGKATADDRLPLGRVHRPHLAELWCGQRVRPEHLIGAERQLEAEHM